MDVYDIAEKKKISIRRIADFLSPVNPCAPSNKAKHAIRKSIKELAFFPDKKARRLKRLISRIEGVKEENIFFGNDLENFLRVLFLIFNPRKIGIVGPISRKKMEIFSSYPLHIFKLQFGGKHFPFQSFISHIHTDDMIFLSNPHDITGNSLSPDMFSGLIQEVKRTGKKLIVDQSFSDFLPQPHSFSSLAVFSSSTIILKSFSVFYGLAGLPVFFGIASEDVIKMIPTQKISSLAIMAALHSLKDKGLKKRTIEYIEAEKIFLKKGLEKIAGIEVIDTSLNFLLLRIKKNVSNIEEKFLDFNILVETFEDEGERILRLPVKKHKFNALILKALKSIL